MDIWKYFAITHASHRVCNPLSEAKLAELVSLFQIPARGRALDIACGKGELLIRTVEKWGCQAVGVDLSPQFAAEARQRVLDADLGESIEIVQSNGAEYGGPAESFDLVSCLGASWIWQGYSGTLEALASWTKPGGMILVGEPFWAIEPSAAHLEASGLQPESWGSHSGNIAAGVSRGLHFLHAIVSSPDDWDRYEGYLCYSAERYAQQNPNDPDIDELLESTRKNRDIFTKWGRAEVCWAAYLFSKP